MAENQTPEILSTSVAYENPRFRVRHDRLRWPNGHTGDYFVIEGPPFVVIIAERDGRIALVEQYRYTVDEVTRELPKGGIEAGEAPEDAAKRELLEEVGCAAETLELLATIACNIGNARKRCYVFLAKNAIATSDARQKDATEGDLRCAWVSIDDLRAEIRAGKIRDQDSLAAWAVYYERRGKP